VATGIDVSSFAFNPAGFLSINTPDGFVPVNEAFEDKFHPLSEYLSSEFNRQVRENPNTGHLNPRYWSLYEGNSELMFTVVPRTLNRSLYGINLKRNANGHRIMQELFFDSKNPKTNYVRALGFETFDNILLNGLSLHPKMSLAKFLGFQYEFDTNAYFFVWNYGLFPYCRNNKGVE